MIYLFSFFFGFFFNEIKITKSIKIHYLIIFLLIVLSLFYISIDIITGEGFNRSFWIHLQSDLIGSTYLPYLFIFIFKFFLFFLFFIIGILIYKKFKKLRIKNYFYKIVLLLFFIFINPASISLIKSFQMTYGNSNINNDFDFYDYFNNVKELPKNFLNRDLVIIAAESLERTFYKNKNLDQLNLTLLDRNDLIDFTNINQAKGYTDWTIAGLMAGNCGLPYVDLTFYSNYNCLSDLLAKRDYNLMSIQGSSLKYAGNGNFYNAHSIKEAKGLNAIKNYFHEKNLEISHWGIHDDIVFNYALNQIKNFESKDTPYAIWINTVDNHPPNGLLSKNCKKISDHISLNHLKVVYCNDVYLNHLINLIISNDKTKNNLIVVHSDHLLMNSNVSRKYFKDQKKRKNLFLIIDPYKIKEKREISMKGNTLDIPATILDYLNGNNKMGLGVSLLQNDAMIMKSLSSNNQDISQIIKIFENNLINIDEELVFLDGKILRNENSVMFGSGLKLSMPLLSVQGKIIMVETDAKGVPRKKIEAMVFDEIVKNNKKINFKAIGECNEFNFAFISDKIQCEFMFIDVKEKEDMVYINIYPYDKKFSKNFLISKKIKKDKFISRVKSLNENPYSLAISWKNFRRYARKNISSLIPWAYPAIEKFYQSIQYNYKKVYFKFSKDKKIINQEFLLKKDTFIAHGGGSVNNHVYTNSLESLEKNYSLGARYFELDLLLTSDNKIVAAHDWDSWKQRTKYEGVVPPTLKNFLNFKIDEKFTPLSEIEIIDWFVKHPDTTLVTDKLDNALLIKNRFKKIQNNLIIELFTKKSIEEALSNNFSKILISQRIIYKNKFSKNYLNYLLNLKNIPYGFAVSQHTIYNNPEFFKKAKSLGFKTYAYNINEKFDKYVLNSPGQEGEVLCNLHNYIEGIYSDVIFSSTPNVLNLCN
jgi:phosphoglycerol transferase